MYSSMSASFIAPRPMARRAEKPVPTPKSMRLGAMPLRVAKALAVTAARRLEGTRTPVPRRILLVLRAAAPMATKGSAVIIWVSKNQAWVKPSSSARWASFQESCDVAMPIPKSIGAFLSLWGRIAQTLALRGREGSLTDVSMPFGWDFGARRPEWRFVPGASAWWLGRGASQQISKQG